MHMPMCIPIFGINQGIDDRGVLAAGGADGKGVGF